MKFSRCISAVVLLCVVMCAPVCAAEITVSAASSLTNAFNELKTLFEQKTPDAKVMTNYASSNALLKQMQEGAPVDVFATADQATMDKADKSNCIDPSSRKNFALNDLVLVVPKDSKANVASAADLASAGVQHIAIGTPASVPAGRYAEEALKSAKLWEILTPKFVMGENVRQVLDYVSRGEADAGFVYATDALIAKDKVNVAAVMTGHTPVSYPISLTVKGKELPLARKFIEFVTSDEGMAVLAKYGFSKP